LQKGCSVLWFPEGTWNLTESLPMLPMKWGIIRIAQKVGAQIIPIALEYDREEHICFVKFGAPFVPTGNPEKEICALRDAMASLRWELWEQKGMISRVGLDIEQCQNELLQPVRDYPPLQLEYEQSIVFHPYVTPQEAFSYLDDLIPCRENAFLLKNIIK